MEGCPGCWVPRRLCSRKPKPPKTSAKHPRLSRQLMTHTANSAACTKPCLCKEVRRDAGCPRQHLIFEAYRVPQIQLPASTGPEPQRVWVEQKPSPISTRICKHQPLHSAYSAATCTHALVICMCIAYTKYIYIYIHTQTSLQNAKAKLTNQPNERTHEPVTKQTDRQA